MDLLNQRMSTEIGCIAVLQICHVYTKLHALMRNIPRNIPGIIDISHWRHWNLGCIVASRWMARSTSVVEHLPWQRSGRCCRWQCWMCTKRNSGLVKSFWTGSVSLFLIVLIAVFSFEVIIYVVSWCLSICLCVVNYITKKSELRNWFHSWVLIVSLINSVSIKPLLRENNVWSI